MNYKQSCDDCLEQRREYYQACSVLYCVLQLCTRKCSQNNTAKLGPSRCRLILRFRYSCFCISSLGCWAGSPCWGFYLVKYLVSYLVRVWLSVPVQSIAWKDSSAKWLINHRVEWKTLLTYSHNEPERLPLREFSLPAVLPYTPLIWLRWVAYVKVIYHCLAAAGVLRVVSTCVRWRCRPAL